MADAAPPSAPPSNATLFVRRNGPAAFAALFAIESFARALVATVVSVQAYDLLGDSQKVSTLFMAMGLASIAATLSIPLIIARSARRWVYTAGGVCLILGGLGFASFTLGGQMAGMLFRVFGSACLNITLSLYILDHIRKADLVHSEPLRLSLSTLSWTAGPWLGVWLYTRYGPVGPQIASIAASLALLALFWALRLTEAIRPSRSRPVNPVASVARFIAQPRLRLAWVIAFGRSCFWSVFFIYGPLLMVTAGVGKEAGGILVSLGNITLATALWWGKLARRVGVRVVIAGALASSAGLSLLAGLAGLSGQAILAGVILWVATIAASALDGVGGIPFLRSVRAHERAQMSSIYRTYIDLSDLLPNVLFSFALLILPVSSVFIILAIWLAIVALIAWRWLPKSM